ncbi:MAG: four helix bundle protein [Candidatus Udaeobacter sp.]
MTNDERMKSNDEARMTNGAIMTKSKDRNVRGEDSFWDERGGVVREEPETKRVYDLEERTALFGEAVIDFARTIPQDAVTNRIINQLVGAGTSVGANYVEADDAVSKKEFLKSIGTCKKEVREAKHFLRMAVRAVPKLKPEARKLWLEARELHLIFCRIWRSGKNE